VAGASAPVKVGRVRVEDDTVTRRPLAAALLALALPVVAGCAGGDARAAEPGAGHRAAKIPSETASSPAVAGPRAAAMPAPCSLVSVEDLSLYVALASWDETSGDQDGRSVCQFTTNGFLVTTVTMPLPDRSQAPAGLCGPPGSTGLPPASDLLCGYTGPGADSATMVAAGSGLAIGVRVVGPDAQHHALLLAQHALPHL